MSLRLRVAQPVGNRVSTKDYYALLGVSQTESLEGIHAAYRRRAKQCHPDRAGTEGKEKFQAIQEAYEILSDPGKRKKYDASIDRRCRVRETPGSGAEPLVSSHDFLRFRRAEPLIRPPSPTEDVFAPASSRCPFCGALANDLGPSCPFCREFDPVESDIAEFVTNFLRAFHHEGFF